MATATAPLGPGVIETIVWVCLAFSILAADIVLQWQDLRGSRPARLGREHRSQSPSRRSRHRPRS